MFTQEFFTHSASLRTPYGILSSVSGIVVKDVEKLAIIALWYVLEFHGPSIILGGLTVQLFLNKRS